MKKKLRSLLIVAALAATIATMFTGCGGKKTLNLNEYVVMEFEGYDGYAELTDITFDYDRMVEDFPENFEKVKIIQTEDGTSFFFKQGSKSENIEDALQAARFGMDLDMVKYYMILSLCPRLNSIEEIDYEGKWKNGQQINFVWEENIEDTESLEKILGLEIKYSDFTYEISNIKEIVDVDIFENLELPLSGMSGKGYIQTHYVAVGYAPIGEEYVGFHVHVDYPENNGSLSNGDIVHVFVKDNPEYLAQHYGIAFTRMEADIEIHGFAAYGDPNANKGEHAIINLNDYVEISQRGMNVYFSFDKEKLVNDHYKSIREDVAEEDLQGYGNPRTAAKMILYYTECFQNEDPFYEAGYYRAEDTSIGDVITVKWIISEETLADLAKLMNAEFVYEDIVYTVEGYMDY